MTGPEKLQEHKEVVKEETNENGKKYDDYRTYFAPQSVYKSFPEFAQILKEIGRE